MLQHNHKYLRVVPSVLLQIMAPPRQIQPQQKNTTTTEKYNLNRQIQPRQTNTTTRDKHIHNRQEGF